MTNLKAREGHDAQVRRDGVEKLAAATRALADAVAETGVDRATLDEVTGALELLTHRLRAEVDDDAYSGLVIKPVDYSIPQGSMPLNPIIGACSPVRPDVELHFADGEVAGTATFTKRFVGPPGLRARRDRRDARRPDRRGEPDGQSACAPSPGRSSCAILRPLPLDEEVELWGVCAARRATGSAPGSRARTRRGRGRGHRRARHLRELRHARSGNRRQSRRIAPLRRRVRLDRWSGGDGVGGEEAGRAVDADEQVLVHAVADLAGRRARTGTASR